MRDLVVRVVLAEGRLQRHERAVAIAELLLVDLRHLRSSSAMRAGASARELGPRQQQVDQLHPALALAIELLELERRRLVPRIDLQHALVDLRRRAAVADLVGPQRGRLHEDVDPLGRVGQRLHAPLEDVDRLLPARLLHEQALERRQRAEVGRIELQHLAPGVDRVLGPHEGVALELAELREQLLELVALDAAAAELADLDQAAQRLRQLLPGARALVVGGDRAERVDVLRIDLQDLLPALERVALARQLLAPDAAQALVDRDLAPRRPAVAATCFSRTSVSAFHSPAISCRSARPESAMASSPRMSTTLPQSSTALARSSSASAASLAIRA